MIANVFCKKSCVAKQPVLWIPNVSVPVGTDLWNDESEGENNV